MSEATGPKSAKQMMLDYFRDFKVLKETRTEYWGIQLINFIDCMFYFAMIAIAAVFLSDDLGLSDQQAGYSITVFTTATTLFLFISGMITDWLGIKRSIYVSMFSMLALRLAVAVVGLVPMIPHRGIIATVLFLLMAPFMAMIQTVFQAANRRFTTKNSRSAGFNLWYLFMNLGAMSGGLLIDLVRKVLNLPNSYIFVAGTLAAVVCVLFGLFMVRREGQLLAPDEKPEDGKEEEVVERKNPIQIAREVLRESAFWKLLVLIGLLLGVRAVFTYMYLLMPKYWLRVIGPDAAMGTLQAINPFLIVIGLILLIPLANRYNIFSMLVYGSMISAVSLFPLALPWQIFNDNIAHAHYIMAIIFLVLLTLGEIVWSPKLSEYTAAIAPKGQEGTYLGLTMVPWFLAKTVVSLFSGHMLERWCPKTITYKVAEFAEKANQAGIGVKEMTAQLDPTIVGETASKMGVDLATEPLGPAAVEPLKAQVTELGYNAQQALEGANPTWLAQQLKILGLNVEQLADKIDPSAYALKLKVLAHEMSVDVLQQGGTKLNEIAINLQLPLKHGWLTFWHSPAAMWFVLGSVALGGAIIARLLRGWLTAGASWQIEYDETKKEAPVDTPPTETPSEG